MALTPFTDALFYRGFGVPVQNKADEVNVFVRKSTSHASGDGEITRFPFTKSTLTWGAEVPVWDDAGVDDMGGGWGGLIANRMHLFTSIREGGTIHTLSVSVRKAADENLSSFGAQIDVETEMAHLCSGDPHAKISATGAAGRYVQSYFTQPVTNTGQEGNERFRPDQSATVEVDPNAKVVYANHEYTFSGASRAEDAYFYYDSGLNTTFNKLRIEFNLFCNDSSTAGGRAGIGIARSNVPGAMYGGYENADVCCFIEKGGGIKLYKGWAPTSQDVYAGAVADTTYYCLMEKALNATTVTVKIYPTDADRTAGTNILDTLTVTAVNQKFQIFYPASNYNDGGSGVFDGKISGVRTNLTNTVGTIVTNDSGDSWALGGVLYHGHKLYTECPIAHVGGNNMLGVCRQDNSYILHQFQSTDNGASWTYTGQTNLGSVNGVKVPSDLIYNAASDVVMIIFTDTGSSTYSGVTIIETSRASIWGIPTGWRTTHTHIISPGSSGAGYFMSFVLSTWPVYRFGVVGYQEEIGDPTKTRLYWDTYDALLIQPEEPAAASGGRRRRMEALTC